MEKKVNYPIVIIFFIWLLATALWWAFAFFQLPGPTPDWLSDARAVCFGRTVTGLPDAKGWMTLVVPPFLLLVSVLFVFYNEFKKSLELVLKTSLGKALAVILSFGVFLEVGVITNIVFQRWPKDEIKRSSREKGLPAEYPQTSIDVSTFNLVDQNKELFSDSSLKGKKTIMTFAFAHCDTICPFVIKNSVDAIRSFDKESYQLVIITLDPWRDRPSRLKAAAEMWKAPVNAKFLSGDVDEVLRVLKSFNVPYQRDLKTGFVTHPALVYALNSKGKIAYSFNNPSVSWLKEALERM